MKKIIQGKEIDYTRIGKDRIWVLSRCRAIVPDRAAAVFTLIEQVLYISPRVVEGVFWTLLKKV